MTSPGPLPGPIVDLDTGTAIARPAAVDASGLLPGGPLPLVLDLPFTVVARGAGALVPLHEALRRSGRHPRETMLLLTGSCGNAERPVTQVTLDGLRTLGYLLGFGDAGLESVPLDMIAEASPYLLALSPAVMARVPRDHRAVAVVRAVVELARGIGAHVLAPGIEEQAQLAAVRAWGVRLAHGPLLAPGPDGRVRVPLPAPAEAAVAAAVAAGQELGPRVQEMLLPAVTLPAEAKAEDVVAAFGDEPSITSVILVDEFQRPQGSLDRGRFLLSIAARYGHALHATKPARRLADPPRTVPKSTPAVAAMRAAGQDAARVYDDLVVTDELNRCMGIVRVSDLIRQVTAANG
ncbi:EAL domain-containing protein [Nonomuraea indica]|uniref:EAL domain-containing protein n=1 Tax=Nonomuraea indica TaxID=1581193 RepID=A0ABW8A8W6_9ACTN